MVAAQGWRGRGELLFNEFRVSVGEGESVLEMDRLYSNVSVLND